MATATVGERIEKLEIRVQELEELIAEKTGKAAPKKRGWRWFIGIDANNPHFEEAIRLGQEWRYADRPKDEEESA